MKRFDKRFGICSDHKEYDAAVTSGYTYVRVVCVFQCAHYWCAVVVVVTWQVWYEGQT